MSNALAGRAHARGTPTARLLVASRAVFVALTVGILAARVVGAAPSMRVQAVAYLGLMGTVSLWHGGFEHVANLRGRGERFQWRYLGAYVGLVGAAVVLFFVAPVVGLVVAVAVTVFKGGYGGLAVLRQSTAADLNHLRTWRGRAVGALVRGGAVMIVPYLFHPGVYSAVAAEMVALVDPAAAGALGWAFGAGVRWLVGAWYTGLVLAYLAYAHQHTTGAAWTAETAETLLLLAYFVVVPPVLAVGVYFPCWYAARQVARMTAANDGRVGLGTVLARVARGGLLPWLGAVAILGGLAVGLPNPPATPTQWVALYSVFVAAVAVPHVLVGGWLDRKQGIWAAA
jgi:Brp/Blh family beta-carotene 15,15'-monooxygenase